MKALFTDGPKTLKNPRFSNFDRLLDIAVARNEFSWFPRSYPHSCYLLSPGPDGTCTVGNKDFDFFSTLVHDVDFVFSHCDDWSTTRKVACSLREGQGRRGSGLG